MHIRFFTNRRRTFYSKFIYNFLRAMDHKYFKGKTKFHIIQPSIWWRNVHGAPSNSVVVSASFDLEAVPKRVVRGPGKTSRRCKKKRDSCD